MRNLKRILILYLTIILLLMFALPIMANDESEPELPTSFITWEFLGTMSGATTAVVLIVQFVKAPLDKIWKIPTRLVAYIFALIILICVEIFTKGNLPVDRIILILLNAIIVTMAAMGAYEVTFYKFDTKN